MRASRSLLMPAYQVPSPHSSRYRHQVHDAWVVTGVRLESRDGWLIASARPRTPPSPHGVASQYAPEQATPTSPGVHTIVPAVVLHLANRDRKSTRLNSSHVKI